MADEKEPEIRIIAGEPRIVRDGLPPKEETLNTLIDIEYINYKGENNWRTITPISIRFGTSQWHTIPQWLLKAYDTGKEAEREFALTDIKKWERSPRSKIHHCPLCGDYLRLNEGYATPISFRPAFIYCFCGFKYTPNNPPRQKGMTREDYGAHTLKMSLRAIEDIFG